MQNIFSTSEVEFSELCLDLANLSDLQSIYALECLVWPKYQRCSLNDLMYRLIDPKAFCLVAKDRHLNKVVGSFFGLHRYFSKGMTGYSWASIVEEATGRIDPNSIFGVSVTIDPEYARKGLLRSLFNGWRAYAKNCGYQYIFGGSRIPGLIEFDGTPKKYVEMVSDGQIFDSILSKYISCNLRVGSLLPNYFQDEPSLNYGVEVYDYV